MKPMGRIDPRWPVHRGTSPKHIRPKLDDSSIRSHESELTRTGLAHVGRNFPLAYLLMGLPGSLANVPTSRREHAILNTLMVEVSDSLGGHVDRLVGRLKYIEHYLRGDSL